MQTLRAFGGLFTPPISAQHFRLLQHRLCPILTEPLPRAAAIVATIWPQHDLTHVLHHEMGFDSPPASILTVRNCAICLGFGDATKKPNLSHGARPTCIS